MSLGEGFPVVGIILTNTSNGTTMFRMGADFNLEIALERCLTETFQGRDEGKSSQFIEYPIHKCEDIVTDGKIRHHEYLKSLKDGTGLVPDSIFWDKPIYDFSEPILKSSGNRKEDLQQMFDFLFERGYEVLIRDNSFLGFCAYHVIIPGLSDQNYRLKNIFNEYFSSFYVDIAMHSFCAYEGRLAKQWALYNINAESDIRDFVMTHYPNDNILKLAPYCTSTQNQVNKHLLLFLSAVKNHDYKDANTHFTRLMQQRQKEGLPYNEYMACVGSYICRKALNDSEFKIIAWLSHFYSEPTIQEVLKDFSIPEKIMRNYSFPTCFDCHSCSLATDCHYTDAIAFEEMIQKVQMANPIDQTKLLELLN